MILLKIISFLCLWGKVHGVSCPSLPNPANGIINIVGNTAGYTCYPGYEIGFVFRTCDTNTGVWSGVHSNCTIKDCGIPSNPQNGYTNYTSTTYGSVAVSGCLEGYILTAGVGGENRTCTLNKTWTGGIPTCTIIRCSNLTDPVNGRVTYPDNTYSSTATFTCNEGYGMNGDSQRTCGLNGWNSTSPNCTIKDCGRLEVTNGDVTFSNGLTTFNEIASYTCKTGYDLRGSATRTCEASGNWSLSAPTCVILDCGSLTINNGVVTLSNRATTFNETATYTCNTGYYLTEEAVRTCEASGRWSMSAPTCVIRDCGFLSDPVNGLVNFVDGTTYNRSAAYSCIPGYEMNGPMLRVCQADGSWEGIAPTCLIHDCGAPPTYNNTQVNMTRSTYGSTVSYSCNTGYNRTSRENSALICNATGYWDGTVDPCLPVDCGLPAYVANSVYRLNGENRTTYGSVVNYSCATGYYQSGGQSQLECNTEGQWTGNRINCTIYDCGLPTPVANSVYRLNGENRTTYGSHVNYSCVTGYYQSGGVSQLECSTEGQWTGNRINCTIYDCGAPPTYNHTQVNVTRSTYGSTVSYTCYTGYNRTSRENSALTCNATGHWNGTIDPCLHVDCGLPAYVANSVYRLNGENRTTYGSVVNYSCATGYYQSGGVSQLECNTEGQWTGNRINCTIYDCGLPTPVANSVYRLNGENRTTYGSLANYSCVTGYFQSGGVSQLECNTEGQWTGNRINCSIYDCGAPPTYNHTQVNVTRSTYGSTVSYTCNTGYNRTSRENSALICNATGHWDGTVDPCLLVDCGLPSSVENSVYILIGENRTTYGSFVNYSCATGYYQSGGVSQLECNTVGQWTGNRINCTIYDCGTIDSLPNGFVNQSEGTLYNATTHISCLPGFYRSPDQPSRTCTHGGNWSGLPVSCSIRDCGLPATVANSAYRLNGENRTTYGSHVNYSCVTGYYQSGGVSQLECNTEGQWTGNRINCTIYDCGVPSNNSHAQMNMTSSTFGSIVSYSCMTGFNRTSRGNSAMTCNATGHWDGTVDICLLVDCGNLTINNGVVTLSNGATTYNATAIYTCDTGYLLSGEAVRTCEASGSWSMSAPTCVIRDCGPLTINKGVVTLSNGTTTYTATATYTCNTGYYLTGVALRTCEASGNWSMSAPTCECGGVLTDPFGVITSPNYPQNYTDFLSCAWVINAPEGSRINVEITDFALEKQTNGTCVYDYLEFFNGPNASSPSIGKFCGTVQPSGFKSQSNSVRIVFRTHVNITDRGFRLTYSLDCGPLTIENGGVTFSNNATTYNETATYTCATGYYLTGDAVRTCDTSGIWSMSAPTCVIYDCGNPSEPENGLVNYAEGTTYNQSAAYSCIPGYEMNGIMLRVCQADGSWKGTLPTCQLRDCGNLTVNNGVVTFSNGATTYNATATYTCYTGYLLNGEAVRTCEASGSWSSPAPTCVIRDCGVLQEPVNGTVQVGLTTFGSWATYVCNPGLYLLGNQYRQCDQTGNWTGTESVCLGRGLLNFAVGKVTSLSLLAPHTGSVAVDGDTSYDNLTCFTTNMDGGVWWQVDIGTVIQVHTVTIYYKVECCGDTALTIAVLMGQTQAEVSLKGSHGLHYNYTSFTFYANDTTLAQFVRLQSAGQLGQLAVCEVKVYGKEIDCGPYHSNVVNMSISANRTVYGSIVEYTCLTGHMISRGVNSFTALCTIDATWNGTAPNCRQTDCGPLSHPNNGRVFVPSRNYQAISSYTCNRGYWLNGTNVRTCHSIGLWDGESPRCVLIDCGSLTAPANGVVTGNSVYNSTAVYTCDVGFEIVSGDATRICLEEAAWTGIEPNCSRKDCGTVNTQLTNGKPVTQTGTKYEDTILYECTLGYMLSRGVVSRLLYCSSNGIWNGTAPTRCVQADCGPLSSPSNGRVAVPRTVYQSPASFTCNPGYDLIGSNVRHCAADGIWSNSTPVCQIKDCGRASNISNGSVNDTATTFGALVVYTCNTGYRINGTAASIRCGTEGHWDGEIPTCVLYDCGTIDSPPNGVVNQSEGTLYNATIHISCLRGFYRSPDQPSRTCAHGGNWSGFPVSCLIRDCGLPASVANSVYRLTAENKTTYGSHVNYSCVTGYFQSGGVSQLECNAEGQWTGNRFNCTINGNYGSRSNCTIYDCGVPPTHNHTQVNVTSSIYGSTVSYSCMTGYNRTYRGNSTLTCNATGHWDGTVDPCLLVDCGTIDSPPNGVVNQSEGTLYNATIHISCLRGFYRSPDQPSRTCAHGGNWSGFPVSCLIRDCGLPASVANSVYRLTAENRTTYGSHVNYSCVTGYFQSGGVSQLECNAEGQWTGNRFNCTIYGNYGSRSNCTIYDCGVPPTHNHTQVNVTSSIYGSTVSYSCMTGYNRTYRGNSTLTCNATGHWDGTVDPCLVVDCGLPASVANSLYRLNGENITTYLSLANYSCVTGYYQSGGVSQLECNMEGQWTGNRINCTIYDCGVPPTHSHTQVNITMSTYGSTVSYSCMTGYNRTSRGNSAMTCNSTGNWDGKVDPCLLVDCGLPTSVANCVYRLNEENRTTYGSHVNYSCVMGYYQSGGVSQLECNTEGQWTGNHINCTIYDCGGPPNHSNAQVNMTRSTYGSTVFYNCMTGYNRTSKGNAALTCNATGHWDGTVDPCVPVDCGLPASVANSVYRLDGENRTTYLSLVNYRCVTGYYQSGGVPQLECNTDGQWTGNRVNCTIYDCGVPPTHSHAQVNVTRSTYGSTVSYRCMTGYNRTSRGNFVMTCNATGHWDGTVDPCLLVDCGLPASVANSVYRLNGENRTTYGSVVNYSCVTGYYQSGGVSQLECNTEGQWTGNRINCTIYDCGVPPSHSHAQVNMTRSTYGSTVSYSCMTGYNRTSRGNSAMTCNSTGHWDGKVDPCLLVDCGLPTSVANSVYRLNGGNRTTYGSNVNYSCVMGFYQSGVVSQLECNTVGHWTGNHINCTIYDCGVPPTYNHAQVNMTRSTYGSTVNYSCMTGYNRTSRGNSALTCNATGHWNGTVDPCLLVDCGLPTSVANSVYRLNAENRTTYGSLVNYSCVTGYYQSGGVSLLECNTDGQWTGNRINCTIYDCGVPPIHSHAQANMTRSTYGSTVSYSCMTGYNRTSRGNSDLTCNATGHWDGTVDRCLLVDCGIPVSVANSVYQLNAENRTTYGSLVNYSCEMGYYQTGGVSQLECNTEGQWTGNRINCTIYDCGVPPIHSHAQVNMTRSTYGSTVPYSCMTGYNRTSRGNSALTCNATGHWDGTVDPCLLVDCGVPASVENSVYKLNDQNRTAYGSHVNYSCVMGYYQSGDVSKLECNNEGQWKGNRINCTIYDCGVPPNFNHAQVNMTRSTHGSTVSYSCMTGYNRTSTGNTSMTCNATGHWDGKVDPCLPVDCGVPPTHNHTQVNMTRSTYGSTVSFSCMTGYKRTSRVNSAITCNADGHWDGTVDPCLLVDCGAPPNNTHAQVNMTRSTYGSTVSYSCMTGYNRTSRGNSAMTCNATGHWDGIVDPCLPVDCGLLSAPSNGAIQLSGTHFLDTAVFSCHRGYQLSGPPSLTCQLNALWDNIPPVCQLRDCGRLAAPSHGSVTLTGTVFGNVATYTCNTGYYVSGIINRVCTENGTWGGAETSCRIYECEPLQAPDNGNLMVNGSQYGAMAQFSCSLGYQLFGHETLSCIEPGIWNFGVPTCAITNCGGLVDPPNGRVSATETTFGQVASYTCNSGYLLNGMQNRVCMTDGQWSGTEPVCRPRECGMPPSPRNGYANYTGVTFMSSVLYQCNKGYRLAGSQSASCQATGSWLPSFPPTCIIKDCGTIDHMVLGSVTYTQGTVYNSIATFSCPLGYRLLGNRTVTCLETGMWSANAPACTPVDCGTLAPLSAGQVTYQTGETVFESVAIFSCNVGHIRMGQNSTICTANGSWDPSEPPICQIRNCGNAPSVPFSTSNGTGTVYGSTRFYTCNTGYRLAGERLLTCREDGIWSTPPACVTIMCTSLTLRNGQVTSMSGNVFGSTITIQCNQGYYTNGSSSLTCGPEAQWIPNTLCLIHDCGPAPDVGQGTVVLTQGTIFGSIAQHSCETGYQIFGPVSRHCGEAGKWEPSEETRCTIRDCGLPATVGNATVRTDGGTTFSQQAVYICNEGYGIFGISTLSCLANGQWSHSPPMCRITDCKGLSNPPNGKVVAADTTFGQVATYTCDVGYQLSTANGARRCQADGTWSGQQPTCRITDCGALMSPTSGVVEYEQSTYGSQAVYKCNRGFNPDSGVVRTCQDTGKWSGLPPVCRVVDCGNRTTLENGRVLFAPSSTQYGATVILACNLGYRLLGNSSVTCTESGAWSTLPLCQVIDCGQMPSVSNGQVLKSTGMEYGSTMTYGCLTGYELQGPAVVSCLDTGSWSVPAPVCDPVDCGQLLPPNNGNLTVQGTILGSVAAITCNVGYQVVGSPMRICQANKAWSGTSPVCNIRVCPSVSSPVNGKVSLTPPSPVYGSVARYTCDDLYQLSGQATLTCRSDGAWSSPFPTCILKAGFTSVTTEVKLNSTLPVGTDLTNKDTYARYEQEVIRSLEEYYRKYLGQDIKIVVNNLRAGSLLANFSIIFQNTTSANQNLTKAVSQLGSGATAVTVFNQTVTPTELSIKNETVVGGGAVNPRLTCEVYQLLIGPCDQGYLCQVVNSVPECMPDPSTNCGVPVDIDNGYVTVRNGILYGAIAEYTCNIGYGLSGNTNTRTCQPSGRWSGIEPTCQPKDCGPVTAPQNGRIISTYGTTFNSRIVFSCSLGYSLIGVPTIMCESDGRWNAPPPTCNYTVCGDVEGPLFGSVFLSVTGQIAVYTCRTGYQLQGNATRTCLPSNMWSGTKPDCTIKNCGTLPHPTNGAVDVTEGTTYGAVARYKCVTAGHVLVGSSLRTCEADGTWSGQPPSCVIIRCGVLFPVTNGNVVMSGTLLGDKAFYTCDPGYRMAGPSNLSCLETGWSDPSPTCIATGDCGSLFGPTNGRVTLNSTVRGSRASYSCSPGYFLSGLANRTCQLDNTWSGTTPICNIVDCGILPSPEGGVIQMLSGSTYGTVATLTCNAGYTLVGPSSMTCLQDGRWSYNPACSIKNCGTLGNPTNGFVDTVAGTTYGSTAQYMCNPGYNRQGTRTRSCLATGQWSGSEPTCSVKDCGPLPAPSEGTVTSQQGTTYGQTARYTCNPGYQLLGATTRLCQENGLWTEETPVCRKYVCPSLASPSNATVAMSLGQEVTSVATYTCNAGYQLSNQSLGTRTCGPMGQWNGTAPTCILIDCGPLPVPTFGQVAFSGQTTYGNTAILTCNRGYTPLSQNVRICSSSGQWSGVEFQCKVIDCGPVTSPGQGSVSYPAGTQFSQEVIYVCKEGYGLQGTGRRVCGDNGTWSGNQPTCALKDEYALAIGLGVGLGGGVIFIIIIVVTAVFLYQRSQRMETKRRPTYVPTFSDASNLPLKINTGVPNLLVPYTEEVEYLPHDQVFTYDNTFYYNQPTESAYTHYDT